MKDQESIWTGSYRMLTIGIIFAVTAVAFEGLAVTTIAPALVADLQGQSLYAWVFSAYLLAQLVGTIVTGQMVDRMGPTKPFLYTMFIFAVGILMAALASGMPMLIVGRALQGFGAGAMINCVYSAITLRFNDALRTQILAVFSSAYVLPGLVGPYFAGLITELLSWRYVFWVVLPLIALSALLTTPSFRGLRPAERQNVPYRIALPTLLAAGTGILLTGLSGLPKQWGILLSFAGVLLLIGPIRRILPTGTLAARPGLPAILASRGLFVSTYFGTQTYLVLGLTDELGFSADTAGLAVASAAISWSLAANVQARLDRKDKGRGRSRRIMTGLLFMLIGTFMVTPQVWMGGSAWSLGLAIASQMILGFGIGLAHPTSGAMAFSHAASGEEGKVSADLTVADTLTPAVVIGAAGAAVVVIRTAGLPGEVGISVALAMQAVLVMMSLAAAARIQPRP